METSGDQSREAWWSVSDADELLGFLLDEDQHGFSSLLDSNERGVTASLQSSPVPAFDVDETSDLFQLRTAALDTQFEEARPYNNTQVTTKRKSTFQRTKEELAHLQSQLADLEGQLSDLRDSGRPKSSTGCTKELRQSLRQTTGAASLSLWKVVAKRQRTERTRVEQENLALRKLLKQQKQLAKSLKQMLRKRLALLQPLHARDQLHHHQLLEVGKEDSEVFQVLLHNIDQRRRTVDSTFKTHGLTVKTTNVNSTRVDNQSMCAEFVNAVLIAVDLLLLSTTIWSILCAGQARPEGLGARVIQLTDDVIVMKHVIQSPLKSTGKTESTTPTVMHTVLKRVTQDDRMLLLWERLIEKTEAATSSTPDTYLSQFGCVQIVRTEHKNREGRPASLAQSYVQLKSIQMKKFRHVDPSGQTHQQPDTPHSINSAGTELEATAALFQQNRLKFFRFIESELDGVVRGNVNSGQL